MTDNEKLVYFFGEGDCEGDPERKDLLGGKGAGLAAMSRAGLPVPPGFTLITPCCRYFLEQEEAWPPGLDVQVREHLGRLERATGCAWGRGPRPLLVSVRSGAAVSMPGMMDTLLNCGLPPDLAATNPARARGFLGFVRRFAETAHGADLGELPVPEPGRERATVAAGLRRFEEATGTVFPADPWRMLVECINAVFRSWRGARAVAYRRRHGITGLAGTAVTVQAMFPSEVSGVLFTRAPNRPAAPEMLIEAWYGPGEAVVSGEVTPDRFRAARADGRLLQVVRGEGGRTPHDAESLSAAQVAALCDLGRRVEENFGHPMDIEWGWAEGRFALLQCRPIRASAAAEVAREAEAMRREAITRLRRLSGKRRRVWVAHNLGETLRAPTPLTWDVIRRFMSGAGGFGLMYRDLGYRPGRAACERGFLELVCGQIYADPERLADLFWEGVPLAYDPDAIARDRSVLDRAPTRFDPERADGRFLLRVPHLVVSLVRTARRISRLRGSAAETFTREVLPPYLDYVRRERERDLAPLSTAEVLAVFEARRRRVLDDFGKESLKPGFAGALALGDLEARLAEMLGPEAGRALARRLTSGLDGDSSVEQNIALHRVATGAASMADFLAAYGHRASGEMELAEPRWREDTAYLERMVTALRRGAAPSPEEAHAGNVRLRLAAERDLSRTLAAGGAASLREEVEAALRDAQALLPFRETGKHYLMMGYELLRLAALELDRRWDLGGDVFFLRLEELAHFERDRTRLEDEIARRKVRRQSVARLDPPEVIDSTDLEALGLPRRYEAAERFVGQAVAPGGGQGRARVVRDPRTARDLGVGYVLVCPSTDPGWTPLFAHARGLVVERGGALSHGAIVARDFGIPAVVFPDATRRIPDGRLVAVDGDRGEIVLLDEEAAGDVGTQ